MRFSHFYNKGMRAERHALMTHPEPIVDRDYRRVLAHADQALLLQKGQVVLQGSAHDVAGSPALSNYLGV